MRAGLGRISGKLLPANRATRSALLAVLAMSAALVLLPEVVRLDGKPHADWLQFLGRLHPLAVHLPIGLILLVPVLEIAGRARPALREAAGFVLGLACVACLGTLMLGYLLAYGSGDSGATVTWHMWGGISLSIGMLLCVLVKAHATLGMPRAVYPALLGCTLCALFYTAHQGGSLTHGANYLTVYMPAPLKRWMGSDAEQAGSPDPNSFYARQVHTTLDRNCVSCHGAGKVEGGLRLDSFAWLMKGGKDGPVVVPRDVQRSLLIERITLPSSDRHFMPAEGRPPLKAEEIAWIRAWIQQGASPTVASLAGVSISEAPADPPVQPVGDYSALMPEIQQMQQAQGAKLLSVSARPSDGLILSTVDAGASFTDAQLAQFQKFAPYVVEADLGRTGVTDASLELLGKFPHLRVLHLEGTAISGRDLARLAPLKELTYLNLSETKVDSGAVAPLASMKNLHHIYLFDTPAQPVPAAVDSPTKTGGTQ